MPSERTSMDHLIQTVRTLREKCAWTAALTHESLRTYLIEESYEVLDAIGAGDAPALKEELGDVFFQILLHSLIAEEQESFTLEEVAATLDAKLLRRNRHVFDAQGNVRQDVVSDVDEIIRVWDAAKQAERGGAPRVRRNAGLPAGLPSLTLAQKLLDRHTRADSPAAGEHRISPEVRGRVVDERSLAAELMALTARAEQLGLDAESVLRDQLQRSYGVKADETSSPESGSKR
ncbi:MazG nucleotide pyrophosphohydrolase domain-containing protein [Glutamicibacter soli]|uniref:Nucleotide pyrophosphohydrolase n=1 Tax=Glutamicibacter soli TaxID=453836 RepID=A0A365YLI9_9MICC|nr:MULTISPECIES: MazG nucleotide pyrophosphohydrolase domain-containing protein [Micrococcaceae]KLI89904.1 hypothetical protein AA310_04515 [Arthrobacter sp. YC-RL1]RBM02913.1 nucleotide pyrophosphohydrolase [Glutamicibacter soli]